MFLTAPELEQLTGYRRYSKQREVLEHNAVPYFTAASGRPVVLKDDLVQRRIRPDGPPKNARLRLAAKTV